MPWTWVNDLLAPSHKKKAHNWDVRCPYARCPSNEPHKKAPRLKFVQKISPLIYQYRCRDCGCPTNYDISVPTEAGWAAHNPALHSGKPNFGFHV